jgi:hypothetical protein
VDLAQALLLGCLVAAMVAWGLSLPSIDPTGMNDLGLISVLPPLTLAAAVGIMATFVVTISRRPSATWLLLLETIGLVVALFAITALVESAPRFSVSWRHAGIIEVLTRTGQIDPTIDAYFSWPAFFALGAFLTQAAGLHSAIEMAPWTPLAFNLMYLPAVLMIMRAGTTNPRIVWVGAWLFFIGNWIGQDYFSPQGLAYFFYLLVVGLVLTMFRSRATLGGWLGSWFTPADEPDPPELRPMQRAALMSVILILFWTTVYSHQLTPFAIIGVVVVLVAARRVSASGLPIVMLVLLGTWLSFMTVEYLSGHIASMISRIGNVDTTVAANLTDRFRGSPLHVLVLGVRSVMTLAIFGLAGFGALIRIAQGRRDLTWGVLAIAPFGLLLLQDYGGEMLLRVYLFSLPFAAFLAAHFLVPAMGEVRPWRATVLAGVLIALMAAFPIARYGNERMDAVTAQEAEGMGQLYELAPPGSELVALTDNVVWKWKDYELYHYRVMEKAVRERDVDAIVGAMGESTDRQGFLVVSRSQLAAVELRLGLTPEAVAGLAAEIENDPRLELVYQNQDVEIFTLGAVGGSSS